MKERCRMQLEIKRKGSAVFHFSVGDEVNPSEVRCGGSNAPKSLLSRALSEGGLGHAVLKLATQLLPPREQQALARTAVPGPRIPEQSCGSGNRIQVIPGYEG